MAQVINYLPDVKFQLLCSKGNLHCQEPLNIVCLDPLCRNDPLACSVCFANIHKHHQVVPLDQFLNDYQKNVKNLNQPGLKKTITRQLEHIRQNFASFKQTLLNQFIKFEESIQYYGEYLLSKLQIRNQIGTLISTQIQPNKIQKQRNAQDLTKSIRFILNNCLFDEKKNMTNVSQLLIQDKEKVLALLDRMVNLTELCQNNILKVFRELDFAQDTIRDEKRRFNVNVRKAKDSAADPMSIDQFTSKKKEIQKTLIDNSFCGNCTTNYTTNLKIGFDQRNNKRTSTTSADFKRAYRKSLPTTNYQLPKPQQMQIQISRNQPGFQLGSKQYEFKFSKFKHDHLTVKNSGLVVTSNITALKPQFALISPHLNLQPQKVVQWDLKINQCRDLASGNTLAVGLTKLNEIKLASFEKQPKNTLLINSQGYVSLNDKTNKTDFIFGNGDVLHFKYDPFYDILEVKKRNGRKITLKTQPYNNEPLYICTRLTYASDQVQIA